MSRVSKGWLPGTAKVVLGCAVAVAASSASWSQTADPGTQEPASTAESRRALIDAGESPGLFLLYTGDVIGYLDPCG